MGEEGHKVVFREKADEMPDADTGDVVFVLKEQEHPDFKRKGADLYIERTISLVEALCGFELEVTHLDGRRLLIKTAPGDITRPVAYGFDPLAKQADCELEWECIDGHDCPGIESVARAEETEVDVLKMACQTQLRLTSKSWGAQRPTSTDSTSCSRLRRTPHETLSGEPTRGLHACITQIVVA